MNVLELGVGHRPRAGATVRHDRLRHSDHVDVAHDLEILPWPWSDEEFDEIWAFDVFEHLRLEVQIWLDECWRILKPAGLLKMQMPAWDHWTSWVDPTHRRPFHERTFDYWDRSTEFWRHYGSFYFADSNRWWTVKANRRSPDGAIHFILLKEIA